LVVEEILGVFMKYKVCVLDVGVLVAVLEEVIVSVVVIVMLGGRVIYHGRHLITCNGC
jgi:hypothetical protein